MDETERAATEERRKRRARMLRQSIADLGIVLDNSERLQHLQDISDEEWSAAAQQDEATADTESNGLTHVQVLALLAMHYTAAEIDRLRAELVRVRKRAYEDELTLSAAAVGHPERRGSLQDESELAALNANSASDAQSIADTYNRELTAAIIAIGAAAAVAGQRQYARQLSEWDTQRNAWKVPQTAQYAENSARSAAQQAFTQRNEVVGVAVMMPTNASCPVCQGWIARGMVPISVAENNPPPYHPNCPHVWELLPDMGAQLDLPLQWMGG